MLNKMRVDSVRTFCEFSSVELSSLELDSDNVSERFVEELDGYTET